MINKKAYIASKCEADLTNYDPNEMKAIAKFLGLYDNGIFENISVDFSTLNFPLEISYSYHEPEKKNPFKIDMKNKTYHTNLRNWRLIAYLLRILLYRLVENNTPTSPTNRFTYYSLLI